MSRKLEPVRVEMIAFLREHFSELLGTDLAVLEGDDGVERLCALSPRRRRRD